jgi:tRNA dimethylallyltransferase
MPETLPIAVFLMGPTAVGKTALATALHERLGCGLVSVDSSQVYRGMDIGTAKPPAEQLREVPQALIDIRDPDEPYSAAEFCQDAVREIAAISGRGNLPVLAGGTMFYFRALDFGLPPVPPSDPEVRAGLQEQLEREGVMALHRRVGAVDPESAQRIDPNDRQRVLRALEIIELTGHGPAELARTAPAYQCPVRPVRAALWPSDRARLRERIAGRFHAMLAAGLVDEVEALLKRGDLGPHLPSMRMVGYRQVWQYLTGELTYNEMIEQAISSTRQLAKRQMTWLRHYPDVTIFEDGQPNLETRVADFVQRALEQMGTS